MEDKFVNYTTSNLSEFRKSIAKMGEPVKNGTAEIPLGLTKGRKYLDKIKIEDMMRTPYTDVLAWRKFSRVYYAHPLYRRLLEYFAYIFYNQYIITPVFNEGKKPNKKKLLKYINTEFKMDQVEDIIINHSINLCSIFYYI